MAGGDCGDRDVCFSNADCTGEGADRLQRVGAERGRTGGAARSDMQTRRPIRIVITGTSGAGKTTLARAIAAQLALPHIELDAINWQAGWRDLVRHDPPEFIRRVTEAAAMKQWVADGNYGLVRDLLWRRATHLVWLDYDRPVVMRRVVVRSLSRAVTRTELWPGTGNRERWWFLLQASHPIRWAWNTWRRRRTETEEWLARPEFAHLVVFRLRRPREARGLLTVLTGDNLPQHDIA